MLLRYLREQRDLSLRELAQLAQLDHAYIHRLERGEKQAPSADVVTRLARVLKASPRDKEMLQFVARQPDADPELVEFAIENDAVTADEFCWAASAVYRGSGRPDPETLIKRVRRILQDELGDE